MEGAQDSLLSSSGSSDARTSSIFFLWIYTFAGQVIASGVTRTSLYNWSEYTPCLLAALIAAVVWIREEIAAFFDKQVAAQMEAGYFLGVDDSWVKNGKELFTN